MPMQDLNEQKHNFLLQGYVDRAEYGKPRSFTGYRYEARNKKDEYIEEIKQEVNGVWKRHEVDVRIFIVD